MAVLCTADECRFDPLDVELGIYRDNTSAIRAYRRPGCKPLECEIRRGHKPNDDIVDMVRYRPR
ncbi:hypothetical protein D3260_15015 [Salinisphaera sp. Q1T1-3]|nr:hypothetical protein D3260_15015 [Salinisphaera sp. Q1T1-3]